MRGYRRNGRRAGDRTVIYEYLTTFGSQSLRQLADHFEQKPDKIRDLIREENERGALIGYCSDSLTGGYFAITSLSEKERVDAEDLSRIKALQDKIKKRQANCDKKHTRNLFEGV